MPSFPFRKLNLIMVNKNNTLFSLVLIITGLALLVYGGSNYLKNRHKIERLNKESRDELIISYPFNHSVFPPEIAPVTFKWNTARSKNYTYSLRFEKGDTLLEQLWVYENVFRAQEKLWNKLKIQSAGSVIDLKINVVDSNFENVQYLADSIQFSFSPDSVSAPLFFRLVDLPFSKASERIRSIEWRLASVEGMKSKTLLTGSKTCANCHSFSNNGKYLGIDIDYKQNKGAYAQVEIKPTTVIENENFFSWSSFSGSFRGSSGFLSSISPNGRYVITTGNDRAVSSFKEHDFTFFPFTGCLVVHDRETGKFWELEGANDKTYVHCNATWSPDGSTLVFARAKAPSDKQLSDKKFVKEMIEGKRDFKYDLWKIPFNNGLGGVASPVKGASDNAMSNYFAKVSPCGKWILFTQSKNFMLRQPDSKLLIVPFDGGVANELKCNLKGMNSWHSWSPNGKWIAFSTKGFGEYTRIALSHIDESGNASPAVLLEDVANEKMAVNLPEFVNIKFEDWNSIALHFDQPYILANVDFENLADGFYPGEWKQSDKYLNLTKCVLRISISNRAVDSIQLIEFSGNLEDAQKMINRIVNSQTVNPQIIKPQSEEEMVVLKAVENALSGGY